MRLPIQQSLIGMLALSTSIAVQAEVVNVTARADIELKVAGTYESGIFDEGAAEIAAYDPWLKRLYVTNADANTVDVLNIRNIRKPRLKNTIDLSPYGDGVNSVAALDGIIAVAVQADPKQDPGSVVFFDAWGNFISVVQVGALPDMLTFTPDGQKVLVANEGEPNDDYTNDPEGSISIIDLSAGVYNITNADVTDVGFAAFNGMDLSPVRIFGPGASVAQDLEPEYIAVSDDSTTAWVVLQENNALAVVDLLSATVTDIVPLGTKYHNTISNALDGSNEDGPGDDGAINIKAWPVFGMYQPDAIASYTVDDETYLVTANEGDAREYDAFEEEARIKDVDDDFTVDPTAYPDIADLADEDNIGRLKLTIVTGDTDGDGDIDQIHSFGARSFSIWNSAGEIVYDSGSDFERITATVIPENFNATNDENNFDNRSDDKGPEPEGVTVGKIGDKYYAFIGLERVGGIMVYDVTSPLSPQFVQYINNRDFSGDAEAGTAGDLGPEGLLFIPEYESPNRKPLLVVTNEVSGTTTIYKIDRKKRRHHN